MNVHQKDAYWVMGGMAATYVLSLLNVLSILINCFILMYDDGEGLQAVVRIAGATFFFYFILLMYETQKRDLRELREKARANLPPIS